MENPTVAQGYAIVEKGGLMVATISPTDIGAMVNWLVVSAGILVTNATTDDQVRAWFQAEALPRGASLVPVTIALDPSRPRD